jgi:hypothetical protein
MLYCRVEKGNMSSRQSEICCACAECANDCCRHRQEKLQKMSTRADVFNVECLEMMKFGTCAFCATSSVEKTWTTRQLPSYTAYQRYWRATPCLADLPVPNVVTPIVATLFPHLSETCTALNGRWRVCPRCADEATRLQLLKYHAFFPQGYT